MYKIVMCCLIDFVLYVDGKQLRSCLDDRLLNHTVSGQDSRRQLTTS